MSNVQIYSRKQTCSVFKKCCLPWKLIVRFLLRYINLSFISLSIVDATIYWGGSLVEKIINRRYFETQSLIFLNCQFFSAKLCFFLSINLKGRLLEDSSCMRLVDSFEDREIKNPGIAALFLLTVN